jgi:hypothetical protein
VAEQHELDYANSGEYSLGCPAEEMYEHLAKYRQQVIDTGRRLAKISIPSVFPPDAYHTGDRIGTNNQSFNALCVNTLASKLMFMAMSPFRPILRFQPIEHKLQKDIDRNPHLWSMVQEGLAKLEIEHRQRLEATQVRSKYVGAIKVLLVAGNVCWEHMDIDRPVYHLPTKYVVKRNAKGHPLITIIADTVDYMDLDEDVKELVKSQMPESWASKPEYEKECTIYRVCKLVKDPETEDFYWEYWEEFKGKLIPDTEMTAKYEEPPLWPAWMIPVEGQNWGRAYCEEYEGDMLRIEKLEESTNDAGAIASLLWLFLAPGARTSRKQLLKSPNLSVITGSPQDVQAGPDLNNKIRDLQFMDQAVQRTVQRLGRAFLMVSSVQRDAERVTAEEWARMAQEIDEAMGGLYSELGQGFQSTVVRRFVALHNEDSKSLPKLPEGLFRVAIVSAIDSMGRAAEGEALVKTTATVLELFKEEGGRRLDIGEFIKRLFTSAAVPQQGLVKPEEVVMAERQQEMKAAMMQNVVQAGAGPAAQALAKAAPAALTAGAQQPQPEGEAPPSPADAQAVSAPPQAQ